MCSSIAESVFKLVSKLDIGLTVGDLLVVGMSLLMWFLGSGICLSC